MVPGEDRRGRRPSTLCPDATASGADLGTNWEQDWQYHLNAATMYVRQGSIVTALQSKLLSITATCFQYHVYGRRTGLKIQRVCQAQRPAVTRRETIWKTSRSLASDAKSPSASSWQISQV